LAGFFRIPRRFKNPGGKMKFLQQYTWQILVAAVALGGVIGQVKAVSGVPEKVTQLQIRVDNHEQQIREIKEIMRDYHREQNSKLDTIINRLK
jgi:hypothetical protein